MNITTKLYLLRACAVKLRERRIMHMTSRSLRAQTCTDLGRSGQPMFMLSKSLRIQISRKAYKGWLPVSGSARFSHYRAQAIASHILSSTSSSSTSSVSPYRFIMLPAKLKKIDMSVSPCRVVVLYQLSIARQTMTEEERKLFRLYGKLPTHKNVLTKMQKVSFPALIAAN